MQAKKVYEVLREAHALFPGKNFRVTFCGSGGQPFAEATHAFFVQEVVANALAVRATYPDSRVAIELGGQDAKVVFFEKDKTTGRPGRGTPPHQDGSIRKLRQAWPKSL